MERNTPRLDAEAQEEQHKCSGLLGAGHLCRGRAEAREVRAAADLNQKSETEEQAPSVDMGHDDVEQSRSPRFLILVVKRDEPVGNQRHHFPPDQKEETISDSKTNRQPEKQKMK